MDNVVSLRNQFSRIWLTLVLCFFSAAMGITGVFIASLYVERPVMMLTRDPAAVTGSNPFIGLLSNIGIMMWSASAAICLFGAILLGRSKRGRQFAGFLMVSGFFTLVLALDDLLLLHEKVFPEYFKILQINTYTGYVVITAVYLYYFFRKILSTDYLLLILALLFLGMSLILDSIFAFGNIRVFIEDSFKFLGIIFWLGYFSHATYQAIHASR